MTLRNGKRLSHEFDIVDLSSRWQDALFLKPYRPSLFGDGLLEKKLGHKINVLGAIVVAFGLAACGGGGDDSSQLAPGMYKFVPPVTGAKSVFSETLVDDLNNTVSRTINLNVDEVKADGSYTVLESDPNTTSVVSSTANHTFYPTSTTYNSSGQKLRVSVFTPNVLPVACFYQPVGPGAPSSMATGDTWDVTYSCGSIAYTQVGKYFGTESVSVPAGVFTAHKLQSMITWTANGITTTESTTQWQNAASSGSRTLKETVTYTYTGGNAAPGRAVSVTRVLQSFQ